MSSNIWKVDISRGFFKSLKQFFAYLLLGRMQPLASTPAFPDISDQNKPFNLHYQKYILPHVYDFEAQRQKALQKIRPRGWIALFIFFAAALCAYQLIISVPVATKNADDIAMAVFLLATGLAAWTYAPVAAYKKNVKEIIYPNVFSFFGSNFVYNHEPPVSVNSLEEFDIIPRFDRERNEDYVKGIHTDVVIELFESELITEEGMGRRKTISTVFNGMFILLDMNKNFSGKTIVKEDKGKVLNWLQGKVKGLQPVRLEDPIFENKFEVFSSDQVEARYLLTTSFMERISTIADRIGSKSIQCSFFNRKILLMVPTDRDRFEVSSIFVPTTFIDECQGILREMDALFDLIEHLKLHQRTGL